MRLANRQHRREPKVSESTDVDGSLASGVGSVFWEMSGDMLAIANQDGYLTAVNPSWERVLGHTPEELTSRSYLYFVHSEDLDKTIAEAQALADPEHVTAGFRNRYRSKHGSYHWLDWSARLSDDGEAIYCVVRDVTEQLSDRQALADSERRYRLLAENATDVVWLVDPVGTFTWVSPSTRHVLGNDPKDLLGTDGTELVHPEDLELLGSVRARLGTGESKVDFDARIRITAGEYRWMSGTASLALDSDGSVVGRLITLRDIHERVLAREALARSEQTFRLALDGAPQGMAVVGLHGRFRQVNEAFRVMVGRDRDWFSQHTESDLQHPDGVERCRAVRDRLLASEAEFDIHDGRLLTANGEVLWVRHSLALVRDEYGMPLFYVTQYQDITDSRALNRPGGPLPAS